MDPGDVTETPPACSFWRTMSARPFPYSDASSMTAAFFTCNVSSMYEATAGPCASSLATARWKMVQPFVDSDGFVADAVMIGSPAWLKMGLACFDSPENAGPTMATTFLSLMAVVARAGAWAGSPWLSNGL